MTHKCVYNSHWNDENTVQFATRSSFNIKIVSLAAVIRLLSATVLLAVISCCPKVFDEFTIQGDRLEQFRALSFSLCLSMRTWGEEQDHRKGHKLMTIECVHRFMVLVELIWSRANILLDLPFQFLFHWRFHRVQNMICKLIDDCVGDSLGDWASWNRLFINYSSLNQQRLKVCVLFIMYNKSNWILFSTRSRSRRPNDWLNVCKFDWRTTFSVCVNRVQFEEKWK